MTNRLKITLLISVVALAFVLGLTVEWWAGGLLALVAGLFGRAVVPRDDAVSNRPDRPDHRPTEYVDPAAPTEFDDEDHHANQTAAADTDADPVLDDALDGIIGDLSGRPSDGDPD